MCGWLNDGRGRNYRGMHYYGGGAAISLRGPDNLMVMASNSHLMVTILMNCP